MKSEVRKLNAKGFAKTLSAVAPRRGLTKESLRAKRQCQRHRELGQKLCKTSKPCKPCTENCKDISLQIYFLCVRTKSHREGKVGPGAIRFDFGAIRFRFGAIRFRFGAIRFCFDRLSIDFDGLSINFSRLERLLFTLTASGL